MGEYDVTFMPGVPSDQLDADGKLKPEFVEYNEQHNPNYHGFAGREITESVPPPPDVAPVAPPAPPTLEELKAELARVQDEAIAKSDDLHAQIAALEAAAAEVEAKPATPAQNRHKSQAEPAK